MNISFNGIIEFVAVAETHGFSAAARKLGVNVSHISRKVAALEKELGVTATWWKDRGLVAIAQNARRARDIAVQTLGVRRSTLELNMFPDVYNTLKPNAGCVSIIDK